LASLRHPSKFQRVSRLGFVTAPTSFNGGQPNFARCLAVSWAGTLYIHFRRLLPHRGILSGAQFTLCSSLAFSYIGSVTARTRAVCVSQTLRRGKATRKAAENGAPFFSFFHTCIQQGSHDVVLPYCIF